MKRMAWMLTAWLALAPACLAAQENARARAERTLPAEVLQEVTAVAAEATAAGIPEGPIYDKALEGTAKRVPPGRLMPALRAYAGRLGEARGAFGPEAGVPLLVAGADALQRGVTRETLQSLTGDRARSPMAVLVLSELVESGVPADRALAVLREAIAQRARDERVLDIPAQVRRMIREGRAPRDAAERIRDIIQRSRGRDVGPPVPPGSEPAATDRVRVRPPGG